jgi:hypothetical protein
MSWSDFVRRCACPLTMTRTRKKSAGSSSFTTGHPPQAQLAALAVDIPAAALSPLFGIGIETAVRWTHRAKCDRQAYIQARATTPKRCCPRHDRSGRSVQTAVPAGTQRVTAPLRPEPAVHDSLGTSDRSPDSGLHDSDWHAAALAAARRFAPHPHHHHRRAARETPHARRGPAILRRILTHEHTIGVQRDMAAHSHPSHATPRYAAIAALFTALETMISDYKSTPEHERVQRWSDDSERITGEVARHLAIARARLSVVPPHDAERG